MTHAVRFVAAVAVLTALALCVPVDRIQAREFAVTTPPEAAICKECDLKMLCHAEGIISRKARG